MNDDERELFCRLVEAFERLAEVAERAYPGPRTEVKPATLGTAAYTEEARERIRLKKNFRKA